MTKPPKTSSTPLRRRSDVRFRLIDREGVVLRQDAGETLVLNEVGARILDLLDGSNSLDDVVQALHDEYEADLEAITSDVEAFASELLELGLVEQVS
ncbi:MAG: PqqD family protein [Acidobacteriota bacterium]